MRLLAGIGAQSISHARRGWLDEFARKAASREISRRQMLERSAGGLFDEVLDAPAALQLGAARLQPMSRRHAFKTFGAAALALGLLRTPIAAQASETSYCYSKCVGNAYVRYSQAVAFCELDPLRPGEVRGSIEMVDYVNCLAGWYGFFRRQVADCKKPYCGNRRQFPPLKKNPGGGGGGGGDTSGCAGGGACYGSDTCCVCGCCIYADCKCCG